MNCGLMDERDLKSIERLGRRGWEISNFRFEMAMLTTCAEKSKAGRGFRRSGAEILQTEPKRPISARVEVNGRGNRAARSLE